MAENERYFSRCVLVTGAAGAIGQPVSRQLLQRGHQVRGFDRHPMPHLPDGVVGDLSDLAAVEKAMAGIDTVIHLAAYPNDAHFTEVLLEPNVRGLFHVCDAARRAGAQRLILASTLQVASGHGWDRLIRVEDGPAPTNHYALTKVWAESMGEMVARCYGLSVVSVRIGWLPRNPHEAQQLLQNEIGRDVFFSHRDAARFFTRCVESPAPEPGEARVFFATSRPATKQRLDLTPARNILGYEPLDIWPEGLPFEVKA